MSEKCVETDASYRLVLTRKGQRPLFMGACKVSSDVLPRKLVAIETTAVHYAKLGACRTSRIIQSQKTDAVLLPLGILTRVPQQAGESV